MLSVNAVGTALVPFQLARKPKFAVPPAPMAPLYDAFVTVTAVPDWVTLPLHSWVMVCPLANVQRRVQPLIAAVPVFVIFTSPWKPPGHDPTMAYATRHDAVPPVGDADADRDAVGEADADGEAEADLDADGDADADLDALGEAEAVGVDAPVSA